MGGDEGGYDESSMPAHVKKKNTKCHVLNDNKKTSKNIFLGKIVLRKYGNRCLNKQKKSEKLLQENLDLYKFDKREKCDCIAGEKLKSNYFQLKCFLLQSDLLLKLSDRVVKMMMKKKTVFS